MCSLDGPPLRKPRPRMMADDLPMPIYLDHNATTPVSDVSWAAMLDCREVWGNPSSNHPFGLQSKFVVEEARKLVANCVGDAKPEEIFFTSGGTEANNTAIFGGALANRKKHPARARIITTNFEHPAVEEVLRVLAAEPHSFVVVRIPVNKSDGRVPVADFQSVVQQDGGASTVALVTIMAANNEIGSVQPITELVKVTREMKDGADVVFHTDAAQVFGKIPVHVGEWGVDMLTVCSHKFYGPKGVGALYVRSGVAFEQLMFGAGHERGLRPGTENIILINGMAAALHAAVSQLDVKSAHYRATRDHLLSELRRYAAKAKVEVQVNGDIATALPNTLSCAIFHPGTGLYVSSAKLVSQLGPKVAFSFGSACHAVPDDPEDIPISAPLKAIGVELPRAIGTLRLSTGELSTMEDMTRAAQIIIRASANQMPES